MTRLPAALAVLLLAAGAAQAQSNTCSDHASMVEHLTENWGESRQSIALDAGNSVVEVYASAETGTWTILVTSPGGPTCMIATGDAFELVAEAAPLGEGV